MLSYEAQAELPFMFTWYESGGSSDRVYLQTLNLWGPYQFKRPDIVAGHIPQRLLQEGRISRVWTWHGDNNISLPLPPPYSTQPPLRLPLSWNATVVKCFAFHSKTLLLLSLLYFNFRW